MPESSPQPKLAMAPGGTWDHRSAAEPAIGNCQLCIQILRPGLLLNPRPDSTPSKPLFEPYAKVPYV